MSHNPIFDPINKILDSDPKRCFTVFNGKSVSLGNLFSHARQISTRLPKGQYAINLCKDRYVFTVSYLAVILRKQINLLPQNQSLGCIDNLLKNYSNSYCINDQPDLQLPGFAIGIHELKKNGAEQVPPIQEDRITSISFTSGSTGQPKAISKTYGEFYKSAQLATNRLGIHSNDLALVSTVPPQHMYGLETSVFWPLVAATTIRSCRPFFPEDIRRAVAESEQPCVLISTPTHLKACVESDLRWTNLAWVLSSTASMPVKLAKSIEARLGVPLMEIFGSTETLSYASRRPTESGKWHPYDGIQVGIDRGLCYVYGGHILAPLQLDDRLDIDRFGCFSLAGRSTDLIKVSGKRASLTELNRLINEVDGVMDGLFYRTDHDRLGALVVSQRSKKNILADLKQSMDEVFLPRPLHRIEKIPRNKVGKIVKLKLDHLIKKLDVA